MRELKIFSGGANQKLADDICGFLHLPVGLWSSYVQYMMGVIPIALEHDVELWHICSFLTVLEERHFARTA